MSYTLAFKSVNGKIALTGSIFDPTNQNKKANPLFRKH